jgi:hypothetical protein
MLRSGTVLALWSLVLAQPCFSQQGSSPSDRAAAPRAAEFNTSTSAALAPRNLAPGVLITVPPSQSAGDMIIGPQDLDFVSNHPELEWAAPTFPDGKPNTFARSETLLELGRDVTLRHPVWGLEFSFKPVRTIKARIPVRGKLEDHLVWYMVYRVRYTGGDLFPNEVAVEAGTGVPDPPKSVIFKSVRFMPRFTLISPELNVQYDSRILSTAKAVIANRERVGKPLLDTMEMSATEILPVSESADNSVWGIATWIGIDPRIDAFYVDVRGLTNAFHREITPDNTEKFLRKTLRIYFWRPGDTINLEEDVIRLGLPSFETPERQKHILNLFKIEEPLDYSWIYR